MSLDSRFLHCVIGALYDSLGAGRPTACPGLRRDAGVAPAGPAAGGDYDVPTYVRRGIVIPGLAADGDSPAVH